MQESQNIEFKQTWRDEYLKWICGFANAEGGVLQIGRNDADKVVGLKDPAKLLEDIPNKSRDYAIPAPIQIKVFADRLKIWNPAVLPDGWNLAKLLGDHASHPYNPDIANAFFRAGEIESWGRGIHRIFEACRAGGAPEPKLSLSGHDLWTEFPFSPQYLKAIGEGPVKKVGEKVGKKVGEKLSENRQKILESIQLNPKVSQKKLAETLGIATKNVETNITYLKKHGYLKRVGPAKGGHWEVLEG